MLVADDQALIRSALVALLSLDDGFEVVAEVGRGDEVVAAVIEHRPDVALLDIEMPGLDGLAAAAAIADRAPDCRVLILTTFGRTGYLRRAMEAGALGFVVKDAPAEQLADAVRRVAAGERVVDPDLAAATLAGGPSPLTGASATCWSRPATVPPSPTSPTGCSSPKAPSGTTSRRRSARPARATVSRRSRMPSHAAGSNAARGPSRQGLEI